MGGSSLAPEVISRTAEVPLTVLDTTDPHQVRPGARRPAGPHARGGIQQERLHHRDRQPPAHLRAGVRRPRPGSGRDRPRFVVVTDPGSPLEAHRPRGRLPRGAGRSQRGRPLQRADRVRPGARPAGGRGRQPAAGRRRAMRARAGLGATATRAWFWAPRSAATRWPATTRSCSPTAAPGCPASATGPSSSSRSPPASKAAASCRWWWAARSAPGFSPGPDIHLVGLGTPGGRSTPR